MNKKKPLFYHNLCQLYIQPFYLDSIKSQNLDFLVVQVTSHNAIQQILQMGLQCARGEAGRSQIFRNSKTDQLFAQMRKLKGKVTFSITMTNLRIVNLNQTFHQVRLSRQPLLNLSVPFQNFTKNDNSLINTKTYNIDFTTTLNQVFSHNLSLQLLDQRQNRIDGICLELQQMLMAPVRHDHLLNHTSSRIIFDLKIDQYLQTDVSLDSFQINWKKAQLIDRNYTCQISLIFKNGRASITRTKEFQKHEKIKNLGFTKQMIKDSDLQSASIKFELKDNLSQHVFDVFVPFSQFQQQIGCQQMKGEKAVFESRKLFTSQKLQQKGEDVGKITLYLSCLTSKLFTFQLDCLIFSQHGIVMTSPSQRIFKSKQLNCATVADFYSKLKEKDKLSAYQFLQLLDQIQQTIDGKQFRVCEQLFEIQQYLLKILTLLAEYLTPQNQFQNMYIWNICHLISHKEILNLKYFGTLKHVGSKTKFATKFYRFIVTAFNKVIDLVEKGLTHQQIKAIHRFMAFAYFRFSWFQKQLILQLSRPNDPVINQQRLAQIGASYALKSPSKSSFYDWQNVIYSLIREDKDFKQNIHNFQMRAKNNSKWRTVLFNRANDQLLYGIYFELLQESEIFLNYNGRIMWQYFPQYGRLLSVFFGQMNKGSIQQMSHQLTKCNMKLMKNEKLLNTFMMLIFPKTCLFETYCVIKCLDLIKCYFTVIQQHHNQLPHDFRYNYFYSAIRCILQSNHSYLLQKMLSLLYKFYQIFTTEFKQKLNNFLLTRVFHSLFLNWSQQVRTFFYLLLINRVFQHQIDQNPENNHKKTKNKISHLKCMIPIEELYSLKSYHQQDPKIKTKTKVPLLYHEKMKLKLEEKRRAQKKMFQQPLMMSSISSKFQSDLFTPKKQIGPPQFCRRKWSLNDEPQVSAFPDEKQMSYLLVALKQFEKVKLEPKPDQRIEKMSLDLQINNDE